MNTEAPVAKGIRGEAVFVQSPPVAGQPEAAAGQVTGQGMMQAAGQPPQGHDQYGTPTQPLSPEQTQTMPQAAHLPPAARTPETAAGQMMEQSLMLATRQTPQHQNGVSTQAPPSGYPEQPAAHQHQQLPAPTLQALPATQQTMDQVSALAMSNQQAGGVRTRQQAQSRDGISEAPAGGQSIPSSTQQGQPAILSTAEQTQPGKGQSVEFNGNLLEWASNGGSAAVPVAVSADFRFFAQARKGHVEVVQLNGGTVLRTLKVKDGATLTMLSFSPRGDVLVGCLKLEVFHKESSPISSTPTSVSHTSLLVVWSVITGHLLKEIKIDDVVKGNTGEGDVKKIRGAPGLEEKPITVSAKQLLIGVEKDADLFTAPAAEELTVVVFGKESSVIEDEDKGSAALPALRFLHGGEKSDHDASAPGGKGEFKVRRQRLTLKFGSEGHSLWHKFEIVATFKEDPSPEDLATAGSSSIAPSSGSQILASVSEDKAHIYCLVQKKDASAAGFKFEFTLAVFSLKTMTHLSTPPSTPPGTESVRPPPVTMPGEAALSPPVDALPSTVPPTATGPEASKPPADSASPGAPASESTRRAVMFTKFLEPFVFKQEKTGRPLSMLRDRVGSVSWMNWVRGQAVTSDAAAIAKKLYDAVKEVNGGEEVDPLAPAPWQICERKGLGGDGRGIVVQCFNASSPVLEKAAEKIKKGTLFEKLRVHVASVEELAKEAHARDDDDDSDESNMKPTHMVYLPTEQTVVVWNFQGELLHMFEHERKVTCISLSEDGSVVVVGVSGTRSVKGENVREGISKVVVYSLHTFTELHSFELRDEVCKAELRTPTKEQRYIEVTYAGGLDHKPHWIELDEWTELPTDLDRSTELQNADHMAFTSDGHYYFAAKNQKKTAKLTLGSLGPTKHDSETAFEPTKTAFELQPVVRTVDTLPINEFECKLTGPANATEGSTTLGEDQVDVLCTCMSGWGTTIGVGLMVVRKEKPAPATGTQNNSKTGSVPDPVGKDTTKTDTRKASSESQQPRQYFIVVMSATMDDGANVPGLAPLMVVELEQPPRAMCINQELVSVLTDKAQQASYTERECLLRTFDMFTGVETNAGRFNVEGRTLGIATSARGQTRISQAADRKIVVEAIDSGDVIIKLQDTALEFKGTDASGRLLMLQTTDKDAKTLKIKNLDNLDQFGPSQSTTDTWWKGEDLTAVQVTLSGYKHDLENWPMLFTDQWTDFFSMLLDVCIKKRDYGPFKLLIECCPCFWAGTRYTAPSLQASSTLELTTPKVLTTGSKDGKVKDGKEAEDFKKKLLLLEGLIASGRTQNDVSIDKENLGVRVYYTVNLPLRVDPGQVGPGQLSPAEKSDLQKEARKLFFENTPETYMNQLEAANATPQAGFKTPQAGFKFVDIHTAEDDRGRKKLKAAMTIANWTDGSRWVSHIKDKEVSQPLTFDVRVTGKFGGRPKAVTITDVSWVDHELQSWAKAREFSSFKVEEVKLEYEITGLKDSLTKARLALKGLSEQLKLKFAAEFSLKLSDPGRDADNLKWSISCPLPVKMDQKLIGSATLVFYAVTLGDHYGPESDKVKTLCKVFSDTVTGLLGSGMPDRDVVLKPPTGLPPTVKFKVTDRPSNGDPKNPEEGTVVFKPPFCKTGTPPTLTAEFEVMEFKSKEEGDAWFEAIKKDAAAKGLLASAARASAARSSHPMHFDLNGCTSKVNSRMEVALSETGPNETLLVKASTLLVGDAAWKEAILDWEEKKKVPVASEKMRGEAEKTAKAALGAAKAAVKEAVKKALKECVKRMSPTYSGFHDAIEVDFESDPEERYVLKVGYTVRNFSSQDDAKRAEALICGQSGVEQLRALLNKNYHSVWPSAGGKKQGSSSRTPKPFADKPFADLIDVANTRATKLEDGKVKDRGVTFWRHALDRNDKTLVQILLDGVIKMVSDRPEIVPVEEMQQVTDFIRESIEQNKMADKVEAFLSNLPLLRVSNRSISGKDELVLTEFEDGDVLKTLWRSRDAQISATAWSYLCDAQEEGAEGDLGYRYVSVLPGLTEEKVIAAFVSDKASPTLLDNETMRATIDSLEATTADSIPFLIWKETGWWRLGIGPWGWDWTLFLYLITLFAFCCLVFFTAIKSPGQSFNTLKNTPQGAFGVGAGVVAVIGHISFLVFETIELLTVFNNSDRWYVKVLRYIRHIFSAWNLIPIVGNTLGIITYFTVVGSPDAVPGDKRDESIRILAAFAMIFLWLNLFNYMRAYRKGSALVQMLLQIMKDMLYFVGVVLILICAFAGGFYALHGKLNPEDLGIENENACIDEPDNNEFQEVGDAVARTFLMSILGDFDVDALRNRLDVLKENNGGSKGGTLTNISFLFFFTLVILISVVALNALIALMGSTYGRVEQSSQAVTYKSLLMITYDKLRFRYFTLWINKDEFERNTRWTHVLSPSENSSMPQLLGAQTSANPVVTLRNEFKASERKTQKQLDFLVHALVEVQRIEGSQSTELAGSKTTLAEVKQTVESLKTAINASTDQTDAKKLLETMVDRMKALSTERSELVVILNEVKNHVSQLSSDRRR